VAFIPVGGTNSKTIHMAASAICVAVATMWWSLLWFPDLRVATRVFAAEHTVKLVFGPIGSPLVVSCSA
jgi:hypothetical protein